MRLIIQSWWNIKDVKITFYSPQGDEQIEQGIKEARALRR
jgi:hypothetical protein